MEIRFATRESSSIGYCRTNLITVISFHCNFTTEKKGTFLLEIEFRKTALVVEFLGSLVRADHLLAG